MTTASISQALYLEEPPDHLYNHVDQPKILNRPENDEEVILTHKRNQYFARNPAKPLIRVEAFAGIRPSLWLESKRSPESGEAFDRSRSVRRNPAKSLTGVGALRGFRASLWFKFANVGRIWITCIKMCHLLNYWQKQLSTEMWLISVLSKFTLYII